MTIKIRIEKLGDPNRGHQLRMQYVRRGMSRGRAAALLGVSVVRLWLLEEGEAAMESPEMWDHALGVLREAALTALEAKGEPGTVQGRRTLHDYMPCTDDGETWRCFVCGALDGPPHHPKGTKP